MSREQTSWPELDHDLARDYLGKLSTENSTSAVEEREISEQELYQEYRKLMGSQGYKDRGPSGRGHKILTLEQLKMKSGWLNDNGQKYTYWDCWKEVQKKNIRIGSKMRPSQRLLDLLAKQPPTSFDYTGMTAGTILTVRKITSSIGLSFVGRRDNAVYNVHSFEVVN